MHLTSPCIRLIQEALTNSILTKDASPLASTKIAAKILFGMVVRERRRIAALARAASTLDEKVQEAEAAVAAKDAAFRAYVDEQRLEAAEFAQNQQQHILSLMDMVREDPESGGMGSELSSPVRSAKARHAEKANSKLLLLANERIAVLERQLNETQLSRDSIQKHRERENEARSLLEEKTRECEDLEEELNELRSALRHIRDKATVHDDYSIGDEGQPLCESIRDIAVQSLRVTSQSHDNSSRRRRRSSVAKGILVSENTSHRYQQEFGHTSESDEVPDWADDIMKDLETIAKGEMPTSLMESPIVLNVEAQLHTESVFDRLNNPDSFTGVQKQRKRTQKAPTKTRLEATTDGQRHRKLISKQVSHNLDKLVVPGNPTESDGIRRASRDSEKDDGKCRSVFDRLLSPSNLTGTQKQRFQDKKGKREPEKISAEDQRGGDEKNKTSTSHSHAASQEADHLLHDILDDDSVKSDSKVKNSSNMVKSESARRREEYKELDVFERLNKTTTQAYAVKQQVNIAEKMLDDLLEESEHNDVHDLHKSDEYYQHRIEAYTQQNVFERLQKTTTMAYAVKHHNTSVAEKHTEDQHDKRDNRSPSPRVVQSPTSKQKATELSDENVPSISLFGNAADQMLDELLVERNEKQEESTGKDVFSPIRSRLRPRR